MPLRRRILLVVIVSAFFLSTFATAKYYSTRLITHIVEQTLIEKAPRNTSPERLRERLSEALDAYSGEGARLEKLLAISRHLEKVPKLTQEELDRLLGEGTK
jgi:hypothetical protein